jgi:hypothetical protein
MPGVWCGGCAVGEMCEAAACVPAVRPFCWGPEERIEFVELEWKTAPVAELGRLMLYGEVKVPGDVVGCSRLGRVPLVDHTTLATTAYELLDSSDFSGLALSGCRDNPSVECEGRVGRPDVRTDGLEMFFESNYRCAELDREIYLSFRRNPTEPWSLPILLPISTYEANTNDSVDRPVLLPDHQTLIHRDEALVPGNQLAVSRRSTSVPGDAAFRRMGAISIEDPPPEGDVRTIRPQGVSCDGRYLLYYRETAIGQRLVHESRLMEIRSLEPLTFGSPAAYEGVEDRFTFGESPDCNALYYAGGARQYVKRRVACP